MLTLKLINLSNAKEREKIIINLSQAGNSNEYIAQYLTSTGFRSPMGKNVLVSTVKTIRVKHGILRKPSQSHPRVIAGFLTIPQLAKLTACQRHWIYDRIHSGQLKVANSYLPQHKAGLYLLPDTEETIAMIQKLKEDEVIKNGLLNGVSR